MQELELEFRSILNNLLSHSNRKSSHKILYQPGPGEFQYTEIGIPIVELNYEALPVEIKKEIQKLVDGILTQSSNGKAPDRRLLTESILNTCFRVIQKIEVTKFWNNSKQIVDQIIEEAVLKIRHWMAVPQDTLRIELSVIPNIESDNPINVANYVSMQTDFIGLSIDAQSSGQSGQESLDRLIDTTKFQILKDGIRNITLTDFSEELDIFIVAMSLGCCGVYYIDDLEIYNHPWEEAPDQLPFFHQRAWPKYFQNNSLKRSMDWNSRLIRDGVDFFGKVSKLDINKTNNWYNLLLQNRKSIFSFGQIVDGFKETCEANAFNFNYYRKRSVALQGIYKIISGLEGLNSECKPQTRNGGRGQANQTFHDCWKVIIERQLAKHQPAIPPFSITSVDDLLYSLYGLRSDIAHSDPTNINNHLEEVKLLLGDWFNPGDNRAETVSLCLMHLVTRILCEFIEDPSLLPNLLIGIKPI